MNTEIQLLLILLTYIVAVFANNETDYCAIRSCLPGMHTICRYPFNRWARRCYTVFRNGLTEDEERNLLRVHNDLRERVHRGRETRGIYGPQPPALDFIPLEWDKELARIAQRWAQQCIIGEDRCRNVEGFLVNQLIGQETVNAHPEYVPIEQLVLGWYEEVKDFNRLNVLSYRQCNSGCATHHYTQMIWSETRKVGCGAIRFSSSRPYNTVFLVCNYGPSGNINGQPIYTVPGY